MFSTQCIYLPRNALLKIQVIRQQPEDLVKFSAVYFANLASSTRKLSDFKAPDHASLRALRAQLGDGSEPVDRQDVLQRAIELRIDEGTLQKVRARTAREIHLPSLSPECLISTSSCLLPPSLPQLFSLPMFLGMDRVMPNEVLMMLLTMKAATLKEVIAGVFHVFGVEDKMESAPLLELLAIFAYQDGGRALPEGALQGLADGMRKVPVISHQDLLRHPALEGRV